jgi:hypothetical protein
MQGEATPPQPQRALKFTPCMSLTQWRQASEDALLNLQKARVLSNDGVFLCGVEKFSVDNTQPYRYGIKADLMSHLQIFPWLHFQDRPRETLKPNRNCCINTVIEAINFFLQGMPFSQSDINIFGKLYQEMEASIPISSRCLTTIVDVHQKFQLYRQQREPEPEPRELSVIASPLLEFPDPLSFDLVSLFPARPLDL